MLAGATEGGDSRSADRAKPRTKGGYGPGLRRSRGKSERRGRCSPRRGVLHLGRGVLYLRRRVPRGRRRLVGGGPGLLRRALRGSGRGLLDLVDRLLRGRPDLRRDLLSGLLRRLGHWAGELTE